LIRIGRRKSAEKGVGPTPPHPRKRVQKVHAIPALSGHCRSFGVPRKGSLRRVVRSGRAFKALQLPRQRGWESRIGGKAKSEVRSVTARRIARPRLAEHRLRSRKGRGRTRRQPVELRWMHTHSHLAVALVSCRGNGKVVEVRG